jgi:hypothetical protein
MDSSIHAHLISQYVQGRIDEAERMRAAAPRGGGGARTAR